MRKKVVAGNWKMNMTVCEANDLVDKLKSPCNVSDVEVVFCVPFTDIYTVSERIKGTNIGLGAQNFYYEDKGAFTGEISANMLCELRVKYVIIGHSERRVIFKEDDDLINKKHIKAHKVGITPILCCGEPLEIRENKTYFDFIEKQICSAFNGINKNEAMKTIIAYEPIWAIGTGKTATSDEAEEVCGFTRKLIGKLYDDETKDVIRILYGGSVKADNAKEIFMKVNIDGGLIGGASLKEEFGKIVNYNK